MVETTNAFFRNWVVFPSNHDLCVRRSTKSIKFSQTHKRNTVCRFVISRTFFLFISTQHTKKEMKTEITLERLIRRNWEREMALILSGFIILGLYNYTFSFFAMCSLLCSAALLNFCWHIGVSCTQQSKSVLSISENNGIKDGLYATLPCSWFVARVQWDTSLWINFYCVPFKA